MKYKIRGLLNKYKITDLALDSRKVKQGYAFFAMPGRAQNGNNYIQDAIDRGACLVFSSDKRFYKGDIVPIIYVENIREALAKAAEYIYPELPEYIVAVTGTNGKTSVVCYARQLFESLGVMAASIGTLGVSCSNSTIEKLFDNEEYRNLTTFDHITLRKALDKLKKRGVNYVALEASSHGIDQGRLHGIKMRSIGFTSFSQDHLDYHTTIDEYLEIKLKLFNDNLEQSKVAVINNKISEFNYINSVLLANNRQVISVGRSGDVNVVIIHGGIDGYTVEINYRENSYKFSTAIIGSFQIYNILIAALLVAECGFNFSDIMHHISSLISPPGRLERVSSLCDPYQIFVDYAHTPDALNQCLDELKVIKDKNLGKLKVIFGCGGDRDKEKRRMMGKVAKVVADQVIITDDNPRNEDPTLIRAEILAGSITARVIPDRGQAIEETILNLNAGDILLIAGKGHENYQIIGNHRIPFSDVERARRALSMKQSSEMPHGLLR